MEKILNKDIFQNDLCMDCIFWYQCRKGEIDCNVRDVRASGNAAKAIRA